MTVAVIAVLGIVHDAVAGLVSGDDEAYDEAIFDSMRTIDEIRKQWESDPESMIEELDLESTE